MWDTFCSSERVGNFTEDSLEQSTPISIHLHYHTVSTTNKKPLKRSDTRDIRQDLSIGRASRRSVVRTDHYNFVPIVGLHLIGVLVFREQAGCKLFSARLVRRSFADKQSVNDFSG